MSFLAGPLEGKEQMVRFHLHRKSLLMHLASCYIWCCVNCIFVGCELLCRGASRRIFPVGISQPLSRSLEYWNIWNIEIFGILEYLEHRNIATTIKVFLLLLRERTSEESEQENSQMKNPNIFAFSNNLRGWAHVILDQKSPALEVLTFLPRHSSIQKPSPALENYPPQPDPPPRTPTHTLIYMFNQISRPGHLRPSTILQFYMSTCLYQSSSSTPSHYNAFGQNGYPPLLRSFMWYRSIIDMISNISVCQKIIHDISSK